MRRREFIAGRGGAAAWPVMARAQQADRMRRIGVLIGVPADSPFAQARCAAFLEGQQQLGWIEGRNVRIDTRWAGANAADLRRHAAELAPLMPDVILAEGSTGLGPFLQVTRSVPIVAVSKRTATEGADHARRGEFTPNRKRRSRSVLFRNPTWTLVEWGL
jgi:putative ABC transport system substrate-binding protein